MDIKATILEIMEMDSKTDPMKFLGAVGKFMQVAPQILDDETVIDDDTMLSLSQDNRKVALIGMIKCHMETIKD